MLHHRESEKHLKANKYDNSQDFRILWEFLGVWDNFLNFSHDIILSEKWTIRL